MSEVQRRIVAANTLAQAAQAIRDHRYPSREQVLSCLDAVESMAYEMEDLQDCLGLEDAFERGRNVLDRRTPVTHEEAAARARRNWNAQG